MHGVDGGVAGAFSGLPTNLMDALLGYRNKVSQRLIQENRRTLYREGVNDVLGEGNS